MIHYISLLSKCCHNKLCVQSKILSSYHCRNFLSASKAVLYQLNKTSINSSHTVPIDTKSNETEGLAKRLVKSSPKYVKPYLELIRADRPIGSWLLFWPCSWGLSIAANPGCFPDPFLMFLFASGSFIMRGAGCTINDMWDKDFDGKVERTSSRPLASGILTMADATAALSIQLGLGCLILLQLNWTSIILGASSLGFVVAYPLMKRITYWPQLVLGITFNWGVLLGWTAVHDSLCWQTCIPLYLAAVSWTLIYDTIYAHQDKHDDVIIGVKSTALKFGNDTKKWITGFSTSMLSGLTVAGLTADLAWPFYLTVGAVGVHLWKQIQTLKIDCPDDCSEKFRSNRSIGLLIFLGIVGGKVLS